MDELRFTDPDALRIAAFLASIGIEMVLERLEDDTFLDGLTIREGRLVVDPDRLAWPGDLLHEAGHIATSDPAERSSLGTLEAGDGGGEMAAIAWSWAAAKAIDLDPEVLFHAGGYKGGSKALITNFGAGRYVGVPLLQAWEMTVEPRLARPGEEAFPEMRRWLR